jgi:hypothetical protein
VFGDENTEAATEDELSKVDESLLDTADAEVNSKLIKKAAQQAEALGLDAEKDLDSES